MLRNVSSLFLSLFFLISAGYGVGEVLLNGTVVYLSTGESYGLYQGYVLSLKSVSADGSVWFELTQSDKIVKSEIVNIDGYFIYTKTNRTIVSVKVDNVYAGSPEQNLLKLLLYQSIDPDIAAPAKTDVTPADTQNQDNNSPPVKIHTPMEPIIWATGIILLLILFYVLRELW